MTYVRANGTLVVSDCPGAAPQATGALGLGADAPPTPEQLVAELKRQINRFIGPAVPSSVQISSAGKIPVTTTLDVPTCLLLQAIMLKRTTGGAFSYDIDLQDQLVLNSPRIVDPAFVAQHLPESIRLVMGYADAAGLPPAERGLIDRIARLSAPAKLAAVAVGGLLFWQLTKRGVR